MIDKNDMDTIKSIITDAIKTSNEAQQSQLQQTIKNAIAEERGSRKPTRDSILGIRDRAERQRLISENMDLFM